MSTPYVPAYPPGARHDPPLIGLQLYAQTIPSAIPSDRFDSTIMHREVPSTLQHVVVSRDASVFDIAATFSLPLSLVASNWLTSRSPMTLPGYQNSIIHPLPSHHRRAPHSRRQALTQAQLDAHRRFAVAVASKLQAHLDAQNTTSKKPPRPSRANFERLHAHAMEAIVNSASPATSASPHHSPSRRPISNVSQSSRHTVDSRRSDVSAIKRFVRQRCAFAPTSTHPDLALSEDCKTVEKPLASLYRCARSSVPLTSACNYYVEFDIISNPGEGGLCIGLSSPHLRLNTLLGSAMYSLGLHSSGKLVTPKGEWLQYGETFGEADTVSLLVEMPVQHSSDISSAESLSAPSSLTSGNVQPPTTTTSHVEEDTQSSTLPRLTFFINGRSQGYVPSSHVSRLGFDFEEQPQHQIFHTAVSLYKKNCCVRMKCCPGEWEYFTAASSRCVSLRPTCHKTKATRERTFVDCESVLTP